MRKEVGDTKLLVSSSSIDVFERDRDFLGPSEKLNDTIVDFFSSHFLNQTPVIVQNQVYLFSSFFFTRLDSNQSHLHPFQVYETVRHYTHGIDVFSKRLTFIPVNKSDHWSLAVVDFLPRENISLPPHVQIFHLDSKSGVHKSEHIRRMICLFLDHEWEARKFELDSARPWPIPAKIIQPKHDSDSDSDSNFCQFTEGLSNQTRVPNSLFVVTNGVFSSACATIRLVRVPQQKDGVNCGIFLLRFIQLILENFTSLANPQNNVFGGVDSFNSFFSTQTFSTQEANAFRALGMQLIDHLSKG